MSCSLKQGDSVAVFYVQCFFCLDTPLNCVFPLPFQLCGDIVLGDLELCGLITSWII